MLSHFSHVWLFTTPWTVAHQAPLSMGFSRQEYWRGLPCPPRRDLPNPGVHLLCLLHWQADSLPLTPLGKPNLHDKYSSFNLQIFNPPSKQMQSHDCLPKAHQCPPLLWGHRSASPTCFTLLALALASPPSQPVLPSEPQTVTENHQDPLSSPSPSIRPLPSLQVPTLPFTTVPLAVRPQVLVFTGQPSLHPPLSVSPQDGAAIPLTACLDSSSAFRTWLHFAPSLLYPYFPTLGTVFKDCQFRVSVGQNSLHFLWAKQKGTFP